jgi:hypothetical protein
MSAVDDDGQSTAAYIHPYNNEGSSSQRYKAAEPPSLSMHDLLQGVVAPTQHSHCSMQNLA